MLPTFVIGLREGLEAALIVGIIAAFLLQENRRDAMRGVWIGVGIAVALCFAAAVGLRLASEQLPQREQEQLETVIGLVAVGMVTWMIVWMRRHAANLRGTLQEQAGAALAAGSTAALVVMAFLAVLREGLETAVFLLAVFQDADDPALSGGGAALGILVAVTLGYLIYRGGVRINLTRFFKFTGVVLALVAAGLLATAVHTAHEAGWWNIMQGQAVDLSWLVKPGTVQFALITAMFGIQAKPTTGELLVWFLYAVPMVAYVLITPKPRDRAVPGEPAGSPAASPAPSRAESDRAGSRATTAVRPSIGRRTMRRLAPLGAIVALLVGLTPALAGAAKSVEIELTDDGCPARIKASAGTTTFEVHNVDASAVSEFEILKNHRVIGERENLTPGLSGSFTADLEPGTYVTYCPGGDRERGKLIVSGAAASSSTKTSARSVAVTLGEFTVRAKPKTVRGPSVKLVVRNKGTLTHELVLLRTDGSPPPLTADGSIDEDALPEGSFVGELEDLRPKVKATLKADLVPGTYLVFCNLVDEDGGTMVSHYHEGMSTQLKVR